MPTLKEKQEKAKAVTDQSVGVKLKSVSKTKKKREKFLRTRMWFSTMISAFYKDRGVIPQNIGNNVMVGNNIYITKHSLNAVIIVKEFSIETPFAIMSDIVSYVKEKSPNVSVDWTLKNRRNKVNLNASDLKSRITTWQATLDNPYSNDLYKKRAARLLYSVDIARSGETLYKSVVYITVRAKTGSELNQGLHHVETYLQSCGALYKIIKNDMRTTMDYLLLMSDKRGRKLKDVPTVALSSQTLSEMLPITQGINDKMGTFLGIDRKSKGPYMINFRSSAKAKNIYAVANSGAGKTFLIQNWFLDMCVDGYNMCIMDIKGTEFIAFTQAMGGIVISMKPSSTSYVNTFKMDPEEVKGDIRVYYDNRFNLSKQMMLLLCDLPEHLVSRGESLLEEFLSSLYLQYGVLAENVNTWSRSYSLNPYTVYDEFTKFLSDAVKQKYSDVASRMQTRLSIYMSRTGSNSHMFRTPIDYKDILDTKVLTFNFGMLEGTGQVDAAMFKVRTLFMDILNDEYVAYKYSKGEWTGKVLEESGIAGDYLLKLYAKDFMLRRSQNQVTILLGNSVTSLARSQSATGILENINILVVGQLNQSSRDYLINEYGLEQWEDELQKLQTDPDYENTFLCINRMQKDATAAMLKAYVPQRVVEGRLFKIVDTED